MSLPGDHCDDQRFEVDIVDRHDYHGAALEVEFSASGRPQLDKVDLASQDRHRLLSTVMDQFAGSSSSLPPKSSLVKLLYPSTLGTKPRERALSYSKPSRAISLKSCT